MKYSQTPPHPLGWPETETLADGRTITVISSRPPEWSARRAHLIALLGAQSRPDHNDGYTYADYQASKASEYAAQDSRQAEPYHYGR